MSKPKKPDAFAAAVNEVEAQGEPARVTPNTDMFAARLLSVSDAQKIEKPNRRWVEPEECVLWERHNRNFELLNEENCRDLIDGFISAGEQKIPAYVRRLKSGAGKAKYEIIAGARRFWTVKWLRENNYPNFLYRIEMRDLTDEEAFRLSDTENRDRLDISPYERAIDYARALHEYYNDTQKDMAARLNKSEAWLSRYITMAQLPVQIPNAYASWHDLRLRHAPTLLKLVTDRETSTKTLQMATALRAQHTDADLAGTKKLSGAEVFKQLVDAGKPAKKRTGTAPLASYGPEGSPHLTLKAKNKTSLTLVVPIGAGVDQNEILKSMKACLKDHYKK